MTFKRCRRCVFTVNCPNADPFDLEVDTGLVQRGYYQWERVSTLHAQGYLCFTKALTLGPILRLFKNLPEGVHPHIEQMYGTVAQAHAYCTKTDTQVQPGRWIVEGDVIESGTRTDLDEVVDAVDAGLPFSRLIREYPKVASLSLSWCKALYTDQFQWDHRTMTRELIILAGPTGCGKTRKVFDTEPSIYRHPMSMHWWDGYEGHAAVLLDDCSAESLKLAGIPITMMLQLADRYPFMVQARGVAVQWVAERIYMTTNCSTLIDLWPDAHPMHIQALRRRITHWFVMSEAGCIDLGPQEQDFPLRTAVSFPEIQPVGGARGVMVRRKTGVNMDQKDQEKNNQMPGIDLVSTQAEVATLSQLDYGTLANPVEVPSSDRETPDAVDPEPSAPERTTRYRLAWRFRTSPPPA